PVPVRLLGVASGTAHVDGGRRSPAEFFFHDLDHARFLVREDLSSAGIEIPDAYQAARPGEAPTTLDPETGAHRIILPAAIPVVRGARFVDLDVVAERLALSRRLADAVDRASAVD